MCKIAQSRQALRFLPYGPWNFWSPKKHRCGFFVPAQAKQFACFCPIIQKPTAKGGFQMVDRKGLEPLTSCV